MTESAVTDLPEPDSPTNATVSPFFNSNEMRSTASNCRSPWRKATERLRTERRDEVTRVPAATAKPLHHPAAPDESPLEGEVCLYTRDACNPPVLPSPHEWHPV